MLLFCVVKPQLKLVPAAKRM